MIEVRFDDRHDFAGIEIADQADHHVLRDVVIVERLIPENLS